MLDENAARKEICRSFAELDRRRAVLFIHPTTPIGFDTLSFGRPAPMVEFLFDTARTVFDFALSGAAARFRTSR